MLHLSYLLHITGGASIVNFTAEYLKINRYMLSPISTLEKSSSWLLRDAFVCCTSVLFINFCK
jgi:hypothetical protein